MLSMTILCVLCAVSAHEAFLPATPPVTGKTVRVLDVRAEPPDAKLLAATLQGLANRDEPWLYLLLAPWDCFWLDHLLEAGHITERENITLDAALDACENRIKTVVAYDPELPASINVATMMAAVEAGVVIKPEMAPPGLADKPITDLRGRWQSNVDAYKWAYEQLFPKMSKAVLACYHPNACSHHLRDYLVSRKVFHFWVTSEARAETPEADFAAEKAFAEKVLAATPANIPVLGFWYSGVDPGLDEYAGVGLSGEYGKITLVTDFASNLSFLGGVNVNLEKCVGRYKENADAEFPELEMDKIYLCFDIVESGDSPGYVQSRQYEVWREPARGSVPINWSLGPALFDLAPSIAAYYYAQATPNDYLYMAISGAGYCHPFRNLFARTTDVENSWRDYLRITQHYLERMGCREVGLYTDAWKPYNREQHSNIVRRFRDGLKSADTFVLGMGRDEGVQHDQSNYFLDGDDGVIVSHIMTRWPVDYGQKTRLENIAWLVKDIRDHAPATRPGFMHVMALSWVFGPAEIAATAEELGDEFVPLTMPQFNRLYRRHAGKIG